MPTRFASPQKVMDLDAPVVSSALLPGLVGVLTRSPARLALVPLGGEKAEVLEVPLESAQDLALLSKDVAVVRAGDGGVWALSGLRGEMKRRQIALGVRALCARPLGESALALGEGGSATALSLSRDEVAARAFTMRGVLRACDVAEHVTWAVTEGEAGGTVRIHPGATPELGTSARAALPEGAAGLDRVRGGASMGVLFKRGEARVCVISGGPRVYQARMVELEGGVQDVAVIEGGFAVAFGDGHVGVYEGGEGVAGSVIAPGGRGRARVIWGAVKGGAAIWVGTSTGEIFKVPLVTTALVEVVTEAPRQAELTKTETAVATEIETVVAIATETVVAIMVAEIETVVEAACEPEAASEKDPREELAALFEAREAEVAAVLAAREAEIEQLRAAHRDEVERIGRGHHEEMEGAAKAAASRERAIEEAHDEALLVLEVEHAAALGRAAEAHEQALAAQEQALASKEAAWSETKARLEAEIHTAGAEREALRVEKDARSAESDAMQSRLRVAEGKTAALEAEQRKGAEERAALGREIERLQREIERLQADLAEERARREDAAPKPGEVRISLDRARRTLGSVISEVEDAIFKRPRR